MAKDLVDEALDACLAVADKATRYAFMDKLWAELLAAKAEQAPFEIIYFGTTQLECCGASVVDRLLVLVRDDQFEKVYEFIDGLRETVLDATSGRAVYLDPPAFVGHGMWGLKVEFRFGWYCPIEVHRPRASGGPWDASRGPWRERWYGEG